MNNTVADERGVYLIELDPSKYEGKKQV